jgi:hypothetical protein
MELSRLLALVTSSSVYSKDWNLETVKTESEELERHLAEYNSISSAFVTRFVYELKETILDGKTVMVGFHFLTLSLSAE